MCFGVVYLGKTRERVLAYWKLRLLGRLGWFKIGDPGLVWGIGIP